ncbi:phage tail protein [Nocardia colli]|uniref:phage tail protein n=1 Tax=Nocardia colli TaxID=2545717 RepID=UPI0035DC77FC
MTLGTGPEGLLNDETWESRWNKYANQIGATFGGIVIDEKDVKLGVEVLPTRDATLGENFKGWKRAWSRTDDSRLWLETPDGARGYLPLRPRRTAGFNPEADPFVRQHGHVDTFLVAGDPRWRQPDTTQKWVSNVDTTDGSWTFHEFTVDNPCDYDLWPQYTLQAYPGAKYRIADYSRGNNKERRAVEDATRVIQMPALIAGEHVRVDTDQEAEQVVSSLDTQIYQRMKGVRFLYPIQADTNKQKIAVGVSGAPAGVGVQLRCRRYWSSPLAMV